MEFPRHCHKPSGQFVVVGDADQYDQVKANGWADQPDAHVEQPVEVRFADAINGHVIDFDEVKPADEASDESPKKRGRKAKA